MAAHRQGAGALVVGASQAGVQLVASLRDFGWTAPITLVGAESHLPYQRPPLSKKALLDGVDPAQLALRSEEFFSDQRIDVLLGERVVTARTDDAGSGVAVTASGRELTFERLALTTGARPRRLDIPGAHLAGIHLLRTSADADRLRQELLATPPVVVVGGGFIGLEVAATARALGCPVEVLLADDRLMARAVSSSVSAHFEAAHEQRGVHVSCATVPTAFLDGGDGRVAAVESSDGRVLEAGVVVVGVGAEPRTELAQCMGLAVAGGVVVDHRGVTSDGVTVAAGDCAVWPTPDIPRGAMRFESVNAATEQAKTAAATLAGLTQTWSSAPWFWSDQFDLKLQVAGHIPVDGSVVRRADLQKPGVTFLHYVGDDLLAVECVNRPADFMAARNALNSGRTIDRRRAGDPALPLKSLVVDRA
jgi:3-phenylpropionate/trans-cinnamate dioxygenase ferredoxin reductase subunit